MPRTWFGVAYYSTWTRVIVIGVLLVGMFGLGRYTAPASPRLPAVPLQRTVSTVAGCGDVGYIPSGCIWGLTGISFVVESASYYEYGLVPGSTPIGDYDYGTHNAQEPVHMPGGRWDKYPVAAIIYVVGSGTVVIAHTPNGGVFSLVHLDGDRLRPGLPAPMAAKPLAVDVRLSDGELTAMAVQRQMENQLPQLHAGEVLRGGDFVAMSKWPLDPAYGNGLAGPGNAHLCLVLDATARAWFLRIAAGIDPAPKPKRKPWPKAWGSRPHKDRHGKLLFQARQWLKHQRLGAYTGHDHWTKKTKTMRYGFIHGSLLCSFKTGKCKVIR